MGYFKTAELKRIVLPSNANYWVDITGDLKYGDLKKFSTLNTDGTVDFAASADLFLQVIIKAWNLDDDQGNVLDITPDNLNLLEQADAVAILNEAGGLVETDAEKKTSPQQ